MTAIALIVDDEVDLCRLMQITLSKMGLQSDVVYTIEDAYKRLEEKTYDFCLTDMRLPDGSGLDLVKYISQQNIIMPIAVITAHGSMDIAIEALKLGAFDFVNKPLELPRLRKLVENALKVIKETETSNQDDSPSRQKTPAQKMLDERLIGESDAMNKLKNTIVKLARSQAPVFLWGESGTGKEVVARLIHDLSPRREGNFVPVNCGAIPSELMESEFFGHKKGSFTGATTDKQGLFQQANGGTLFLDEVADLPLAMQVKLLRAIQEKTIRAIGDIKEVPVDIRVLSATHKDLNKLVCMGSFRQDLFYRINVIQLDLPTLNQRAGDIPMLADHFLQLICKEWKLENNMSLSDKALTLLAKHDFAGNVRELRNILERSVTLSESQIIDSEHLNLPISQLFTHDDNSMTVLDLQTKETNNITNDGSVIHAQNYVDQTQPLVNTNMNQAHSQTHQQVTAVKSSTISYQSFGRQSASVIPNVSTVLQSSSVEHIQQSTNSTTINTSHNLDIVTIFESLCDELVAGIDMKTGLPNNNLEVFLQKQESVMITNALKQTRSNKTQAAKLLGMSLRSLRYRMDKLSIDLNE